MIQWVWEAAAQSKEIDQVIIATDCKKIEAIAKEFGAAVELTGEFANGTLRAAHVASKHACEVVVNLQGDEPLTKPEDLDALVQSMKKHPKWGMTTLAWRCTDLSTVADPDVVKVAVTKEGEALYFSRAPIGPLLSGYYWRHVGIYGFRRSVLFDYCGWPESDLEKSERLEQLRALEHGVRIGVTEVIGPRWAVDRPEDIRLVEKELCSIQIHQNSEVSP